MYRITIALLIACTVSHGQVPRYSVTMTSEDYRLLYTRDVFSDSLLPGPFTSHDTTWPEAQVRFKGHSTRYYAKKSYRVRFSTSNLFHGYRQINFNSMYTDKSSLREKLSWDLFRDLGTLAPTASHAVLSVNGTPQGLSVLIPKVDKYLLQVNGRPVSPMYEANDTHTKADLTVRSDSLLKMYYDKEIGDENDYSDLAALIAALNSADSASFGDTVRHYFDVRTVYRWFAVNTLTMMGDSYNKNYFLYRDTTRATQQWEIIPWDYDLSWGRTGDYAIPYPASLLNDGFAYTFSPLSGPDNVLKDRLMNDPPLREEFRAYLDTALALWFTEERQHPRIDSLAALIAPDVDHDPLRWGTMGDFRDHVDALKYYVTARRNYLLRTFIDAPSGEYHRATVHFAGEGAPHHFVSYDGRLLGTLWLSGVSGLDSITMRAFPDSTPPGIASPGGGRFVRRWVRLIPHPPTAQFTARFQWMYQDVSSTDTEVGDGVGDERLLRAHGNSGAEWHALPAAVNPFANTVTIDSITQDDAGSGSMFALMLSETYAGTWRRLPYHFWERLYDIRFTDSLHGFIVGEHGMFLKTSDGGESWERDSVAGALHFYSAAGVGPTGEVYAAGDAGSLYRSADTGRSWSPSVPGTLQSLRAIDFSGGVGAVAGDNGALFATMDAGTTWDPVTWALPENFTGVGLSGNILTVPELVVVGPAVRVFSGDLTPGGWDYALADSFTLSRAAKSVTWYDDLYWVTGDSGLVISGSVLPFPSLVSEVPVPGAPALNDIAVTGPDRMFVVGEGGAIYYTEDAGISWFRQHSGDTHDLFAVAFNGNGRGFAVGNGGTILRTDAPGTLTAVRGDGPRVPFSFRLLQNYPNPFNPVTRISFEMPVGATVAVRIYDLLGRLVATPFEGTVPAGVHEVGWNAAGEASGVYFYRLSVSDRDGHQVHSETRKMVLMR